MRCGPIQELLDPIISICFYFEVLPVNSDTVNPDLFVIF